MLKDPSNNSITIWLLFSNKKMFPNSQDFETLKDLCHIRHLRLIWAAALFHLEVNPNPICASENGNWSSAWILDKTLSQSMIGGGTKGN